MTTSSANTKGPEHARLEEARTGAVAWKAWGPYLSERQWGRCARITAAVEMRGTTSPTTRRGRALTGGVRTASPGSATSGSGCALSLALWNGADPILKERMFGLNNSEGNHGEDVNPEHSVSA